MPRTARHGGGRSGVRDTAFQDPAFDPGLCAETLDLMAETLEKAARRRWQMAPEVLADVLVSCAELVRYASTWVAEQSKTMGSPG